VGAGRGASRRLVLVSVSPIWPWNHVWIVCGRSLLACARPRRRLTPRTAGSGGFVGLMGAAVGAFYFAPVVAKT